MAASTGTLLAAALETAGYKAQSIVLTDLADMFVEMGAIIFIVCAMAALVTVATMGKYRTWLWFFIGPPLFYFVAGVRTQASGVEWRFGQFKDDRGRVEAVVTQGDLDDAVDAEVSSVFHWYNRVTSNVIQEGIKVLTDNTIRDQTIFMTRQRIMEHMFNADIENPELLGLIHEGLQGQCYQAMDAARQVALGKRDRNFRGTPQYNTAREIYQGTFFTANRSIPEGSFSYKAAFNVLSTRTSAEAESFVQSYCGGQDSLTRDFDRDPIEVLSAPVTCQQIWCWSGMGLQQEAKAIQKRVEAEFVSDIAREKDPEVIQKIWEDISVKMQKPSDVFVNPDNPGQRAENAPEIIQPDISIIPVVIGGILLRKALSKDPRSQMASSLANNSGYYTGPANFKLELTKDQLQTVIRRGVQHHQATALRYETFTFAMQLPYIQGVFLYGLAISFPFFALLLIIPSKAATFFTWMALWFWVKSWDLGWAIIMVADEVLWNLMPHSSVYDPLLDGNHSPITVMDAAFQSDPAYSLSTYYMVLSVMVTGVPMVTAQAVLGGKKAMAGMFINGLSQMGQTIGGAAADWVANDLVAKTDFMQELGKIRFVMKHKKDKGFASQQLQEIHRRAEALRREGEERMNSGYFSQGFSAGMGAAVLAAGSAIGIKPPRAAMTAAMRKARKHQLQTFSAGAVGSALTGLMGNAQWASGLNMVRAANAVKVNAVQTANLDLEWRYHWTNQFKTINSLRAGWAIRGEFWNMTDLPVEYQERIKQMDLTLAKGEAGADAQFLGSALGALSQLPEAVTGRRKLFGGI